MAEVTVTAIVNLRITDGEWRLIMKALAAFSGVPVRAKNAAERKEAESLNKQLLGQRRGDLREQLEKAEAAVTKADRELVEIPPASFDVIPHVE